MMDNLNLKPKSPDEVKTMMWTGENQREMFDLLTYGTAGLVIFWVVWVILIGAAVFGFCYFDNKWLED
jgi:hypothetical protein